MRNFNELKDLIVLISERSQLQQMHQYGKDFKVVEPSKQNYQIDIDSRTARQMIQAKIDENENKIGELLDTLTSHEVKVFVKSLDNTCYTNNAVALIGSIKDLLD